VLRRCEPTIAIAIGGQRYTCALEASAGSPGAEELRPCWTQTPLSRMKIQAAPAPMLSAISAGDRVLPSAEIAT
jgi:hypothetical protein